VCYGAIAGAASVVSSDKVQIKNYGAISAVGAVISVDKIQVRDYGTVATSVGLSWLIQIGAGLVNVMPIQAIDIHSAITANRKAVLQGISIANGFSFTPAAVEEERQQLAIIGDAYMRILEADTTNEQGEESNKFDLVKKGYAVQTFVRASDSRSGEDEILKQCRLIASDVIRAWMADPQCGGLADITRSLGHVSGVYQTADGALFYLCTNAFVVQTRIDFQNPYNYRPGSMGTAYNVLTISASAPVGNGSQIGDIWIKL
jgi:hypothetical protein